MAGTKIDFSPDSYLEKFYQENQPEMQFEAENKKEWQQWRRNLKAKVTELLGGLYDQSEMGSMSGKDIINLIIEAGSLEVLEKREFRTYSRIRIAYQVENYLKIPTYLLIPNQNKEKYPAIVLAHGHGNGSRETLGLNGAGEELEDATCHNNLALDFVEAGYLVIVPELIGFGDRRLQEDYQKDPDLKDNPTANPCYRISSQLLLFGQNILKLRLWDIISALELLKERNDVLDAEISVVGFSGGAPVAILAALFADNIKAAVISGYTSYYQDSIMASSHCLDNYLPEILNFAELPTIISAIAPKPLLIQAAEKDNLFPVDSAKKAYQEIGKVYNFLDVSEKLELDIIENAEHSASAPAAIEFLNNLNEQGEFDVKYY